MTERPQPGARWRLAVALSGLIGLAAVVGLVVLLLTSGSGTSREFDPAPPACIRAWNSDEDEVALGAHLAVGHGYRAAQVTLVNRRGRPAEGTCSVILGSLTPDPEPGAGGQVRRGGSWRALSDTVSYQLMAALQRTAIDEANAQLQLDGTLIALED